MAFLQRNTTILSLPSGSSPYIRTVTKPSGTVEGDIMVGWFCGDSSTRRDMTPPSGWSVIYNQSYPDLGGSGQQYGFYKVATASEPTTYAFEWSGNIFSSKSILTTYYDTNGSGTWTVSNIGAGNRAQSASSTSVSITGAGLYITAFLNDGARTPTTDNSPVAEIARDVSNSLGFITYAGEATALNNTITQNWSALDDVYSNNVIFAHQVNNGFVNKIKVGNVYKDITAGFVATSSGWKEIQKGFVAQGRGSVTTSWLPVFKDNK